MAETATIAIISSRLPEREGVRLRGVQSSIAIGKEPKYLSNLFHEKTSGDSVPDLFPFICSDLRPKWFPGPATTFPESRSQRQSSANRTGCSSGLAQAHSEREGGN